MATLTADQLTEIRQGVCRSIENAAIAVTFTKPQANAAVQAIEDWWESAGVKASLSAAIEAVAPGVFTNAQKKRLVAYFILSKFRREGV